MRKLLIVLFIVLLSGCSPIGRLTRLLDKYPNLIDTNRVTTIVYRDTIINVPVISVDDTTFTWGTIYDTIYASSGTAHAITYVVRDTIRLSVWQSDTVITLKLDSLIKVVTLKDAAIITLKDRTKLTDYFKYGLALAIIVLLIVLIPRVFKKK